MELLSSIPGVVFGGNPAIIKISDTISKYIVSYKFKATILVGTTEVASFLSTPKRTSGNLLDTVVSEIDLSDAFWNEAFGHFSLPAEAVVVARALLREYDIYITNISGYSLDALTESATNVPIENIMVFPTTVSEFVFGKLTRLGGISAYLGGLGFLSTSPATRVVDRYSPVKLSISVNSLGITVPIYITVKAFYSDGTSKILHRVIRNNQELNIVDEINLDYHTINEASGSLTMTKFETYINTDSTNTDQYLYKKTFVYDDDFQPYALNFIFRNSLGVYECMRTTGETSRIKEGTATFVKKVPTLGYTDKTRLRKRISKTSSNTWNINSGFFKSREEAFWFTEFLESDDIMLVVSGVAYPVEIDKYKYTPESDGDFNPSCDFVLTLPDGFDISSRRAMVGDFSADFSNDFYV